MFVTDRALYAIWLQDRDHENDEPTWHVCFGCFFPLLLGPCLKSFGLLKSSAFAWRQPLTWASLYWSLLTVHPTSAPYMRHKTQMQNGKGTFSCASRAQQWDVCYAILFHINDWGRHRWVSKHVFGFCGCHLQAFAKLARFLIICCDGVWDVKTNQQALENVGMNMQCVLWVFPAKWLENANVNSIQVYLSIYIYIFRTFLHFEQWFVDRIGEKINAIPQTKTCSIYFSHRNFAATKNAISFCSCIVLLQVVDFIRHRLPSRSDERVTLSC